MIKRVFDLIFSLFGILLLSPLLLLIAILVKHTSKGGALFLQKRVGLNNVDFTMYKFRTMYVNSSQELMLTIGDGDKRITKFGSLLRRMKPDELPQLFNVFLGNMSLVGPRPEVRKYVGLYDSTQRQILSLKPGITDYASIAYSNENELLLRAPDPEKEYVENILPKKIELNMKYIAEQGIFTDIKIIGLTIKKILF